MFGLFSKKPSPPSAALDFASAFCALLVHIARTDGHYADVEIALIETLLSERFELSTQQAQALRKTAEALQAQASDTVRFTRVIKDSVPYEERIDIVRALWRVVLVDGARDMNEDGLMRLIVNLLGVNDRDSAFARQQVVKIAAKSQ